MFDYQLGGASLIPDATLLSCSTGQARKHTQGDVSLTLSILGRGTG